MAWASKQFKELLSPGPSAGLWLQRHWGSAVNLELEWKGNDAVSWMVAYDAQPLSALQHLDINMQVGPHESLPHLVCLKHSLIAKVRDKDVVCPFFKLKLSS